MSTRKTRRMVSALLLAFTALTAGCNRFGTMLKFKAGELYYTKGVTKDEAQKLGEFLVKDQFFDNERKTVQLNKAGPTYEVRIVIKPAFQQDPDYHRYFGIFATEISRKVFDKAPVVVHFCDEHLKTLKAIEAHRYAAFPEGTLHYSPAIDKEDGDKLATFLVKEKFFDGTPKTAHLDKAGTTYEFRFPVKAGADTNAQLVPVFKQMRAELSQALGNKPLVLRLCNDQLKTIKVVTD